MTLLKTLIQRGFNNNADYYHKNCNLQRQIAGDLYDLAQPLITNDSKILDLGAGDGSLAYYLPKNQHHNLTLLDNSKAMLEIANKQFPECQTIIADFDNLPPLARYDIVFANMSLHWGNDLSVILKQIKQILTPNGKAFISVPAASSFKELRIINQNLEHQLQLKPLIDLETIKHTSHQIKSYIQNFDSLFTLLKHFKKNGTGYKALNIKALTKTDYRYLKTLNNKATQLSWDIIFICL